MKNKYKQTNYLIKQDALNQTINDALSLKNDLNNFASFRDISTNQLFFISTEEQLMRFLKNNLNILMNGCNKIFKANNFEARCGELCCQGRRIRLCIECKNKIEVILREIEDKLF